MEFVGIGKAAHHLQFGDAAIDVGVDLEVELLGFLHEQALVDHGCQHVFRPRFHGLLQRRRR